MQLKPHRLKLHGLFGVMEIILYNLHRPMARQVRTFSQQVILNLYRIRIFRIQKLKKGKD
ncbi:hypothetical protein BEQ56_09315 [Anaerolineaceae bacterium oral taxon 439]|nr:hypothetical protein BEQ56_09315 [Anaerolineaceae bacterium oral taxon 439]